MLTNEIKKGMRIYMRSGWYGTMMDNLKGNIRTVDVEGFFREIGSVYAHDIISVEVDGKFVKVEHTPAQLKLRKVTEGF